MMKRLLLLVMLTVVYHSCKINNKIRHDAERMEFDIRDDLLLLHYDCKTDVDDLHSIAAAASLIRMPAYTKLNYHAVAGSYGVQEGEYVPANTLFALAFGDRWSDAHANYDKALEEVYAKVSKVLDSGGQIWIAEAGQSDFSASLIAKTHKNMSGINTTKSIHIVQHSNWNEEETSEENLTYVKEHSDYQKIPDGNAPNNRSPGYSTAEKVNWSDLIDHKELLAIWRLAIDLADTYNGSDGRYLNKAIKAGGMDFSDFCEVHHILNLQGADNCAEYFEFIQKQH